MDLPEVRLDWRAKGFWLPDGTVTAGEFAAAGHTLFDGSFTWPVLVLRQDAATANIATMAEWTARHGFRFAPHAKTTMAPKLLAAQFAAGAWAMTVATANQALVLRRLGVQRVLIANQVLDPAALRWLAAEARAGWELYLQVDSVEGAERVAAAGGGPRVLVELGFPGGRTGCRTAEEVLTVARAVPDVAGVTGYEGMLPDAAAVTAYLGRLREVARTVGGLVSAGGSSWFDLVAEELAGMPAVLRSGASVTHDDGYYRERTPFTRVAGALEPALELWAQVQSTPEPGLAVAGAGKRDVPFDEGLPVPLEIRATDGTRRPATGLAVTRLNDHHLYLAGAGVAVGDLIRFGISHPCTAFDKWRWIPVVDDAYRVVDVLDTYF